MMKMIKEVILWTILLLKFFYELWLVPYAMIFTDIVKTFWKVFFNGTYVTEGTVPQGSAWAMNPIPRQGNIKKHYKLLATIGLRNDTAQTGQSFAPRCEERPECGSTSVQSDCLCSGLQVVAMVVLMMTRMTIWWYFTWASAIMPLWKRWYLIESSI